MGIGCGRYLPQPKDPLGTKSACVDLNTLFCEVLGGTCVEGSGHAGGGIFDAQLSALAVLGGDGIDVVKDSGGQLVDILLGGAGALTVTVVTSASWPL